MREQPSQTRTNVAKELDAMVTRYDRRKQRGVAAWKHNYYERARLERDEWFKRRIVKRFPNLSTVRCLEIGAGSGKNIPSFARLGISTSQVLANELLDDRLAELRQAYPDVETIAGNALDINVGQFDIIMISTVFSSILDAKFRRTLAKHLVSQLSEDGCIFWYDFSYQNPLNKDVRGIKAAELPNIFDDCNIESSRITLTPPVALLIGPLYRWLAWVPFLKSHVVAIIHK